MAAINPWLRNDLRYAAWLLAATIFLQITALGADGPLLGAIAAAANSVTAVVLIAVARPPGRFLVLAAPPLAFIALGILWAVWPDITGTQADRIAPDLVASDAARAVGNTALLLGTAALGYRRGLLRLTIEAFCVAAAVNLAIGLVLRQIDPGSVWGVEKDLLAGRFTGTMLNANAMGAVYGAMAVLGLAGALSTLMGETALRRPVAQSVALYLLLAGAALAAAGLTGSRTAFFAAALGIAVLVALAWTRGEWRNPRRILAWGAAAIPVAILLAGGLAALQRLQHIGVDAAGRIMMWRHYAQIAGHSGPHGMGLGSFAAVNAAMLPADDRATDLWYVNAAHDVVLQMIIEGGLVYAVLVSAAALMIVYRIGLDIFAAGRGRTLLVAMAAALIVVTLSGMVDIAFNIPGVASFAVALAGLGWGHSLRRAVGERSPDGRSFGQTTPPYRS